ncbi:MAG: VRR-NUC domain-containing protein [Nitrososphaerales archaeon]
MSRQLKLRGDPPESAILYGALKLLALHPAVAWHVRMNSGAAINPRGQYMRFGFQGCPDIIGQLKSGTFFALEIKAPGKKLSRAQELFLGIVREAHGLAWCVSNLDDLAKNLSVADQRQSRLPS